MKVRQNGEHVHVLYKTDGGFSAYRDGFEFEEENEEGISALAAENVIREANGWEPIGAVQEGEYIHHMVCDRDGAIFSSMTGELIRRNLTGDWSTITG